MSDSPPSEPESEFVCDCEEWMRDACDGESSYHTAEGKRYCVLHFPGKEKSADFEKVLQRKLENKDFNLRGVWFPDLLSFSNFDFSEDVDFSEATFSAEANFVGATFSEAAFYSSVFADHVRFGGDETHLVFTEASSLDLRFATIEKPDHVSFHTLSLRPHWFVNVDARKFDFTNVDWGRRSIKEEIRSLEKNLSNRPTVC